MSDEKTELWRQRGEIDRLRREKNREVMEAYDRDVYYPALKKIREECAATGGHSGGKFHDNGFGWSWFYCGVCGARYNMHGPDGASE